MVHSHVKILCQMPSSCKSNLVTLVTPDNLLQSTLLHIVNVTKGDGASSLKDAATECSLNKVIRLAYIIVPIYEGNKVGLATDSSC